MSPSQANYVMGFIVLTFQWDFQKHNKYVVIGWVRQDVTVFWFLRNPISCDEAGILRRGSGTDSEIGHAMYDVQEPS